jgi:cobalamin biosynthesis protein CobD/CbiB
LTKRIYSSSQTCLSYFTYLFRNWGDMIWKYKPAIHIFCALVVVFVIACMIVVALIPLYLPTKGLVSSHINTGMFYFIFLSSFYISKCRRKTIGQSERGDEIKGKRRVKRIEGRNTQNRLNVPSLSLCKLQSRRDAYYIIQKR